MPIEDAFRWNNRYRTDFCDTEPQPRSLLVEHSDWLPAHGLALDIAMGLGGNAHFLINRGLRVVGVDISSEAVYRSVQFDPKIMAVVADLENFYIPPGRFDLIIDFLYLQKDLWQPMIDGLRIGGLLILELLTNDMLTIHPDTEPDFLLRSGELLEYFSTGGINQCLEIKHYYEGWTSIEKSHPRSVASLVARRIA